LTTLSTNQLIIAGLLAGGIALFAGSLRLLSFTGALAALVVGFFVFGFGGLPFAVPLLVFFFSSSILSRVGRRRMAALNAVYEKSSVRDAAQVIANGGIASLLALLAGMSLRAPTPRLCMLLFLAALAAVNADTWATEIGGLSKSPPLLLSTLKRAAPGTSGAVSWLGMLGAALGAVIIPLSAWLAWPPQSTMLFWRIDAAEILTVAWAGFVAAFADSLLGASVQAQYRCVRCGAVSERTFHCERRAALARGLRWMTNDVVNFIASLLGVLFAWLLLRYAAYPL
jgi:uncharacterized protein (TIGR00297 family)